MRAIFTTNYTIITIYDSESRKGRSTPKIGDTYPNINLFSSSVVLFLPAYKHYMLNHDVLSLIMLW